jgi:hypothetical protein
MASGLYNFLCERNIGTQREGVEPEPPVFQVLGQQKLLVTPGNDVKVHVVPVEMLEFFSTEIHPEKMNNMLQVKN